MRRILLLITLCCLALGALAQGPLALSETLLAVRITDPARQLTTYAPLLTMVHELKALQPAANAPAKPAPTLEEFVKIISAIPGANAKGDVWIVSTPPTKPLTKAPVEDEALQLGRPRGNSYLLLPLTDQAAFATFLQAEAASGKPDAARGLVLGKTGLLVLEGDIPTYTEIKYDLPLQTKREVALSLKISNAQAVMDTFSAGEMAAFLMPAFGVLNEMQQNQQRMECGLAMQGDDLSLEFFSQPRPDSALAKALVAGKMEPQAFELAAYLPENMAYCGAGAPMLPGAPGTAHIVLRFGTGLLTVFMPPEVQKPLSTNLEALLAQCRNGRVVGVTTPPAGKPDDAAVVAIYRVNAAEEARTAMRGFAQELQRLSEMMAGAGQGGMKYCFTANGEQIGDVPIDLIAFDITPQQKPQEMRDGMALGDMVQMPPVVKFDARIAYLNNLMLIAVGPAGKQHLTGMLARVKSGQAGFTASQRYTKLKETLPATARGFESISTIDLCKVFIGQFPEKQRKDALMFLSLFPPQRTVISSYQEIKDGTLRGEVRIPQEQMQFVYSLLRMVAETKGQAKAGGEQPK